MKGVIYCYHCIPTGKKYIGQSIDEKRRQKKHIVESKKKDSKFYRAVKKYGWKNFIYGVVEEFSESVLDEMEIFFIEKYNSFKDGYNSTIGGGGLRGYVFSQKSKKLIAESQLGVPKNHGKNVSLALTGRKLSKSHIENIQKIQREKVIGIYKMSHDDLSEAGKKGGKIGGVKGAKKQHKQKWKCLETGFVSTPCGLSSYQKARNIDKSMRIRIE